MIKKFNPYHIVTIRPWPTLSSIQTQTLMISSISLLSKKTGVIVILINFIRINIIASIWWKNTLTEARKEGIHLIKTKKNIKIRILIFISSEVLFFSRFFWAYFHAGRRPNVEIGQIWPPNKVESFNPINVPLLNTIILVRSGFSVTWTHHAILEKSIGKRKNILLITCLLGGYFSVLQKMEYDQSQFSINDSSYGTIFFIATGFHGIHVIIGTTFLLVNYFFLKKMLVRNSHHIGFELAAWYWHFVDVVWLVLYLSIYWWGK